MSGSPGSVGAADAIDLWFVTLPQDVPLSEWKPCLSPDELARARRFATEKLQRTAGAARACLRLILARYTGGTPAALSFAEGPLGKPGLAAAGPEFSLSHAGGAVLVGAVLVGIARRPLGVDLEPLDRALGLDSAADLFLTDDERAAVARQPADRRPAELLRQWTRKEACAKALGLGLQLDLRTLLPQPGGYRCADHGSLAVLSLQPAPGFVAAVAVPGSEPASATLRSARLDHDAGLRLNADRPAPLAWEPAVHGTC